MNFKSSRDFTTMVLDIGSGYTKAGLVLDDYEAIIEPSTICKGRNDEVGCISFGDTALRRKELLDVVQPVQNKLTGDWQEQENYIDFLFNTKLKMKAKNFSILNSYNFDDTLALKSKTIEMFFEKYEVPMYLAINNLVLSIYGYGIRNGVVIDSGEYKSTAACVYDGSVIPGSIVQSKIGGSDVTKKLQELINSDERESKPPIIPIF
jgi:actin-related protein